MRRPTGHGGLRTAVPALGASACSQCGEAGVGRTGSRWQQLAGAEAAAAGIPPAADDVGSGGGAGVQPHMNVRAVPELHSASRDAPLPRARALVEGERSGPDAPACRPTARPLAPRRSRDRLAVAVAHEGAGEHCCCEPALLKAGWVRGEIFMTAFQGARGEGECASTSKMRPESRSASFSSPRASRTYPLHPIMFDQAAGRACGFNHPPPAAATCAASPCRAHPNWGACKQQTRPSLACCCYVISCRRPRHPHAQPPA